MTLDTLNLDIARLPNNLPCAPLILDQTDRYAVLFINLADGGALSVNVYPDGRVFGHYIEPSN